MIQVVGQINCAESSRNREFPAINCVWKPSWTRPIYIDSSMEQAG